MSYLQTSGFWDGGSGITRTSSDKRRFYIDFSKIKQAQKDKGVSLFGTYPQVFANGRKWPVTSYAAGWSLLSWWQALGERVIQQETAWAKDSANWKNLGSVSEIATAMSRSSETVDRVKKVNSDFAHRAAAWRAKWAVSALNPFGVDEGKRADELWGDILPSYTIALDSATWAGANIETAMERLSWAVGEAAKQAGIAFTKPIGDMLDIYDWMLKVTKWVIAGSIAALGLWGVHTIAKKRGTHV